MLLEDDAIPGARVSIVDLTNPHNLCSGNLLGTIVSVHGWKAQVKWDDDDQNGGYWNLFYPDGRWYSLDALWPVGD